MKGKATMCGEKLRSERVPPLEALDSSRRESSSADPDLWCFHHHQQSTAIITYGVVARSCLVIESRWDGRQWLTEMAGAMPIPGYPSDRRHTRQMATIASYLNSVC